MADLSDHALAARVASDAGDLLVRLLESPEPELRGWSSIEYTGDRSAHEFIVGELGRERPDDHVLSEEGRDDRARLAADRVWIVDPLDGSADFGWSDHWSVHVALVERGRPTAAAVAVPGWETTWATQPTPEPIMSTVGGRPRIVVSRSRRHVDGRLLTEALDAEVYAVGSAGVKAMAVVRGDGRLCARGRSVRVGLVRTRRGGRSSRTGGLSPRRCPPRVQQGGPVVAGPGDLPAGAGRPDHRHDDAPSPVSMVGAMSDKPMKVRYTSRSLERHVLATREHAWAVLLAQLEKETGGLVVEGSPDRHGVGAVFHLDLGVGAPLVETVQSFEPPWRRNYRVEGAAMPLDFYEGTFVLRDDGAECHLSWGVVVDPEPSDAGWEFLELAMTVVGGFLDRVAAAAQI
ncbi:MAG: inositol monophosphatase family protein [Acidimicrobiales bacterium]